MIEIRLDVGRRNPIIVEETQEGCWECISHKPASDGRYYKITVGSMSDGTRRVMLLHRFIYEYYIEEIPEGLILRHTCDNVLCINPKHLKVGTLKDNARDMVVRGRAATGERNGLSKLTDIEVDEIRDLYKEKIFNQTELGNTYGVTQSQISNIVRHVNR